MSGAYTATAALYDDFRGESPNMWAAYLDELFEKYAEKKPKTLLDLACGTGTVTAALCRLGYDVTGVDISEEMLALAQKRAPGALLLHQDMRSLDLDGSCGGAVCCLDSV
ncbi:MAG: class I SAM-dependent methyltransferase, partial [Oscillospiraceae bacterium]|nr:class I SAM-dependent methyltransferase [Oscillospiraceae bacterium]